jgi:hypothetical protein
MRELSRNVLASAIRSRSVGMIFRAVVGWGSIWRSTKQESFVAEA